MSILTIASFKGGPGKTTLCQIIAASCAARGLRVAVIDADPTKAMSHWHASVYEGPPFECIAETSEQTLATLALGREEVSDLVLIDTAGFGNLAGAVAMTVADHILVPLTAGAADMNQAEATMKQAAGYAAASRRVIATRAVLNRLTKTKLTNHAEKELLAADIPRLTNSLSHRTAYGEISYSGEVPTKGAAGDEIRRLLDELTLLGWIPQHGAVEAA